ncbi:MAG: hypothetical protein E7183_07660 [Erysipelotrichaceae bacterium]|nr:hypothetical protein [Erysipelotrichaceae bacterium]
MKLKYFLIFTICLGVILSSGCNNKCSNNHEHFYIEGKCECGETDPNYVPHIHNYIEGKCECGETDPNYIPHIHNYIEGKCECGETDPNYVPHVHNFVNGKCECGETDPNYVHVHEFVDGKCECGFEEESEIDKLLKDEEGATEFRVYFNYMDDSEYVMVTVSLNKVVVRPNKPSRDGFKFLGWYTDESGTNLYNFNTPITKSIMLYAIWEEIPFVDYTYLLNEIVPNVVSEDFELYRRNPYNDDIHLAWVSSDPQTISPTGIVIPGDETEIVTLTMEVIDDGYSTFFSKDVEVEPATFNELRSGRTIFGYYASYNFNGYTEDQLKCNVINLSFAYVTYDYKLDMNSLNEQILYGALAARKQGVRVVLSIQGYGDESKNFKDAASTPENRAIFIKNIVDVVDKYHFNGVDLDWEYPGWFTPLKKDSDAENYTALCQELNTALKEKNPDYLLTAAIPGGAEGFKRYNLAECSKYLDYIHLMTYDLEASSKVYHHTALYANVGKGTATDAAVKESVEIFKLKGVPAEKIVVGIAFYGKYTTPVSSTNGGLGSDSKTGKYTTLTYARIKSNFLNRVGDTVTEYWDSICYAPYLYDSAYNYFITYENARSINEKAKYMRKNGLGGVMIWELGEDSSDGELMAAVVSSMR